MEKVDVADFIFQYLWPLVMLAVIVLGFLLATGTWPLDQEIAGVSGGLMILVATIAMFPSALLWLMDLAQK